MNAENILPGLPRLFWTAVRELALEERRVGRPWVVFGQTTGNDGRQNTQDRFTSSD